MINGIEKKNISVKELKKDGRYLNAALYRRRRSPAKRTRWCCFCMVRASAGTI